MDIAKSYDLQILQTSKDLLLVVLQILQTSKDLSFEFKSKYDILTVW